MSRIGVAKASTPDDAARPGKRDEFFLPDFCDPRIVLVVVLVSELLAVTFALARASEGSFLTELARVSFFVQWLGLTSAGLICTIRPRLVNLPTAAVTFWIFALLLLNTLFLSIVAVAIGQWLQDRGLGSGIFALELTPFLFRNLGISLIVGALLLRYFFVAHQWRSHVRAEARSRIDALQARIRPHFLFNSMNTIASLTRSDAKRAEEAVEDLADLFRATLRDSEALLSLKEEFELSRIYQRIEMLRLGDRLQVRWDVTELPMRALIPGLTIQPLLENAIYHGIEPLPDGGLVTVSGHTDGKRVEISVSNPVAKTENARAHKGNQIALDNIRERLKLSFTEDATLKLEDGNGEYRVVLNFPLLQ